ncbi:glycosyltransferase [Mediterraneibacter gnavus]|uniref:Glycosyltransferase family 4 protein n=1 Tax=Mediterraneibacter gnavus TaxID=33038 RepID=A0A8B3C0B0_MEDGN|nr:glycosyltransferase [Mediterraneibacter gnavus]RHJ14476.1 glycosyltransferase family 4 protein [Mediterraneibacter gnavus]
MKVLYISGMYPTPDYPQKGIFCHEQVKALKQIGVDVDVVVPMTVYDKEYETKKWKYEDVEIQYVRFLKLPGGRGYEHIGKLLYYSLLLSGIKFQEYDIIHADAPLPAGDAALKLSKKYKIPFVVHGHGLDVFFDESYKDAPNCKKISKVCKQVYEQANAIAGVSQKVLNCIQERVDIYDKSYVVYNGVDTTKFYPMSEKISEKYILTVGNLIALKGHDDTIKAFAKLVNSGVTDVRLKIAGRGPLEMELKDLVERLGISNYVDFLGYVPYEKIAELMRNASLFCLPSWYEALGCVYLEAMASGIPTIGCYGNGIDEVITDGLDGFLVDNKNVQQIFEKMKMIFQGKAYENVGVKARKTVEDNYKWIDSAKNLLRLYGEIKDDKI